MAGRNDGGAAAAAMLALSRQPLIADDAATVAHVLFNGAGLVDRSGNAWTQNGTVPQVGRSGRTPPGAGPFSDANYYSLGTGNDVLDFAGDFSTCLVVNPSSLANDLVAFSDGVSGVSGYYIDVRTNHATLGPAISFQSGVTTTSVALPQAQQTPTNAVSIVCVGRAGSTGYIKQNLGALTTGAAGTITPGTGGPALIGKHWSAGFSLPGTIYEFWASTTTPSDALFTAIMQRVKQRIGITAW